MSYSKRFILNFTVHIHSLGMHSWERATQVDIQYLNDIFEGQAIEAGIIAYGVAHTKRVC